MKQIYDREWGALVMDEVHMMPALVRASVLAVQECRLAHRVLPCPQSFRRVITTTKAHCRLGLTATVCLQREAQSVALLLVHAIVAAVGARRWSDRQLDVPDRAQNVRGELDGLDRGALPMNLRELCSCLRDASATTGWLPRQRTMRGSMVPDDQGVLPRVP